jgi:hypothetical protein
LMWRVMRHQMEARKRLESDAEQLRREAAAESAASRAEVAALLAARARLEGDLAEARRLAEASADRAKERAAEAAAATLRAEVGAPTLVLPPCSALLCPALPCPALPCFSLLCFFRMHSCLRATSLPPRIVVATALLCPAPPCARTAGVCLLAGTLPAGVGWVPG